jgi:glycerate kinase
MLLTGEMQMLFKVVIAPSGFKESLDSDQAADCIEQGVLRALKAAGVIKVPMVDGGEGFTKTLVKMTNGTLHDITVTGPVGQRVEAHFGFLRGEQRKTAIIEMAAAAGLRHVPRDQRDPLKTTTYGVGELIKAALDKGAQRILLGCGDSGTNDGGMGLVQALGGRFLDMYGKELGHGGAELNRLEHIDLTELDPRLEHVQMDVACNWHNVLCGSNGVARVFGPQKGGTPEMVETMASAMDRLAAVIKRDLGIDVCKIPGGGASGGMGAGVHACLKATLHPRYDIVMEYIHLDDILKDADLVITAEGALDFQTPRGKVPAEVARRAKQFGVPVVALAGTLGKGADDNLAHGIDAYTSIMPAPATLEHAIEHAAEYLTDAAEQAMRQIMVGLRMSQRAQQYDFSGARTLPRIALTSQFPAHN